MAVISNAGDDGELRGRGERNAVGSRRGVEHNIRLQRAWVDRSHAGPAAIGDENTAVTRNHTGCAGKSGQRCNEPVGIGVNHLDAVACRVRDKNPAGLGLEGSVIERGADCMGYADRACGH